jgi:hypothetical protein
MAHRSNVPVLAVLILQGMISRKASEKGGKTEGSCAADQVAARTHRRQRSGNSTSSPSFGSATAKVMLVSVIWEGSEDPHQRLGSRKAPSEGTQSTHLVDDALDLPFGFVRNSCPLRLGAGLADGRLRDELGRIAVPEAVRRQLRVAVEGARASEGDEAARSRSMRASSVRSAAATG